MPSDSCRPTPTHTTPKVNIRFREATTGSMASTRRLSPSFPEAAQWPLCSRHSLSTQPQALIMAVRRSGHPTSRIQGISSRRRRMEEAFPWLAKDRTTRPTPIPRLMSCHMGKPARRCPTQLMRRYSIYPPMPTAADPMAPKGRVQAIPTCRTTAIRHHCLRNQRPASRG